MSMSSVGGVRGGRSKFESVDGDEERRKGVEWGRVVRGWKWTKRIMIPRMASMGTKL